MSRVAIVNGRPAKATQTGQRATCLDPDCGAEMVSRVGDYVMPHWAHQAGESCDLDDRGELGWHMLWRYLFVHAGARTEVPYEGHRADVVLADGRVVEIQTKFLPTDDIVGRESTYGDMAWLYRLYLADGQIIADDGVRLQIAHAKRTALIVHQRPVFWQLPDDRIVRIRAISNNGDQSDTGAPVWNFWCDVVAEDNIDFVEQIADGVAFGAAPDVLGLTLPLQQRSERLKRNGLTAYLDDGDWEAIDEWCNKRPGRSGARRERMVVAVTDVASDIVQGYRANKPRCRVCNQPMVAGQHDTHYSCKNADPACTCHPNPDYRQWVIDNVLPVNPHVKLPEPCRLHPRDAA